VLLNTDVGRVLGREEVEEARMKTYVTPEQRTLGYVVEDKAITYGDHTFLYFKDEEYSYRDLHE